MAARVLLLAVVALSLHCLAGHIDIVLPASTGTFSAYKIRGDLTVTLIDGDALTSASEFEFSSVSSVYACPVAAGSSGTQIVSLTAPLEGAVSDTTSASSVVVGLTFTVITSPRATWMLTEVTATSESQLAPLVGVTTSADAQQLIAGSASSAFSCLAGGSVTIPLLDSDLVVRGSLVLANYSIFGGGPCSTAKTLVQSKCTNTKMCAVDRVLTYDCDARAAPSSDVRADEEKDASIAVPIMLLVTLFSLYCICGTCYKRFVLKAEGVDQLPNPQVWTGLAAGIGSCFTFVRSGCKRSPSGGWQLGSAEPPPYDW